MRQVFDFIRCSKEKQKLRELVGTDAAYKEVDEDANDVMVSFAHATELAGIKKVYEQGGKVNMCQALTELLADERSEGGIEALILDNLEEGITRERILEKLQRRFQLEEEKAKEYYERYAQKSA